MGTNASCGKKKLGGSKSTHSAHSKTEERKTGVKKREKKLDNQGDFQKCRSWSGSRKGKDGKKTWYGRVGWP